MLSLCFACIARLCETVPLCLLALVTASKTSLDSLSPFFFSPTCGEAPSSAGVRVSLVPQSCTVPQNCAVAHYSAKTVEIWPSWNRTCRAHCLLGRVGSYTKTTSRWNKDCISTRMPSTFRLIRSLRPVVLVYEQVAAIDAGHLKGPWKGVMYILTMRDSNNRLIHVSTVIADKENETNYRFLLQQTCKNEELGPLLASGEVTFFIDGHRGSPPALRRVVPLAPVRTCLRHLITNKAMKAMGAVSSLNSILLVLDAPALHVWLFPQASCLLSFARLFKQ